MYRLEGWALDLIQPTMSALITIAITATLVAGVLKLFKIAGDLDEIKSLLKDLKRNSEDLAPAGRAYKPASLRTLSPDEYATALRTEVVSPGRDHGPSGH